MSIKKEFLVKKIDQQQLIFGVTNENKLYMCSDSSPQDKTIIAQDKVMDFSVDIDASDNIHMIVLNTSGELKYFLNQGKSWGSKIISKFDIKSNNYRHLKIMVINQDVHLFYYYNNLLQPGLWTIKHSLFDQQKWRNFRVCDIFSGKYISPFVLDKDSKDNLYLAYKANNTEDDGSQIYLARFSSMYTMWYTPEKISTEASSNASPFIFIDKQDILHFCWSSIIKNNYQICYSRKNLTSPKHQWTNYKVVSDNNTNCLNSIIFEFNNVLYLNWIQSDGIYSKSSKDNGYSWSPSKSLYGKFTAEITLYQYINKNRFSPLEMKNCSFYGYWDGRIKPLCIEDKVIQAVALTDAVNIPEKSESDKLEQLDIAPPIIGVKSQAQARPDKVPVIDNTSDNGAIKGLEGRLTGLEDKIKEIQLSISSLETNYKDISLQIEDIISHQNTSDSNSESIKNDYKSLNKRISELNNSLQSHMEDISSINIKYTDIIGKIHNDYQRLNKLLEENIQASNSGFLQRVKEFVRQKNN